MNFDFLAGPNHAYVARLFQDTTGAFYVIACKEGVYNAHLEIWGADSPTGEFSLLWIEQLPDHVYPNSLHAATSRNGSSMSDVLHLGIYNNSNNGWYDMTVDFAALREFTKAR